MEAACFFTNEDVGLRQLSYFLNMKVIDTDEYIVLCCLRYVKNKKSNEMC